MGTKTLVPYLVRLDRVADRETKIGEALEWTGVIPRDVVERILAEGLTL